MSPSLTRGPHHHVTKGGRHISTRVNRKAKKRNNNKQEPTACRSAANLPVARGVSMNWNLYTIVQTSCLKTQAWTHTCAKSNTTAQIALLLPFIFSCGETIWYYGTMVLASLEPFCTQNSSSQLVIRACPAAMNGMTSLSTPGTRGQLPR